MCPVLSSTQSASAHQTGQNLRASSMADLSSICLHITVMGAHNPVWLFMSVSLLSLPPPPDSTWVRRVVREWGSHISVFLHTQPLSISFCNLGGCGQVHAMPGTDCPSLDVSNKLCMGHLIIPIIYKNISDQAAALSPSQMEWGDAARSLCRYLLSPTFNY